MNVMNDPKIIAQLLSARSKHEAIIHVRDSEGELAIVLNNKEIEGIELGE